jgi:phosphoribosylglycinamide formyltransferase-1
MKFKIAIFASGAGSNAERIMQYFNLHDEVEVSLVVSNNVNAGVLDIAQKGNIASLVISKEQLMDSDFLLKELNEIDVIVLAGFLLLIPPFLISYFHQRIVNLHPSLLPKYGGKGMYGKKVHQAVLENGEQETGITIHLVNEYFDEGKILAQYRVSIDKTDTVESIEQKVRKLEWAYFAPEIEKLCFSLGSLYPRCYSF